jgi:hypothetical protein
VATYGGGVTSQTAAYRSALVTRTPPADVVHGYAPPARPAGSVVVAYCGALMIVRGEYASIPPLDTCAECIAIWKRQRY